MGEINLNYLLYDEENSDFYVDMGLMAFNVLPFPNEKVAAFLFEVKDEELFQKEIEKIKEYTEKNKPRRIVFNMDRIRFCVARIFSIIKDSFKDAEIIFYNIINNAGDIIKNYASDICGVATREETKLLKILQENKNCKAFEITYSKGKSGLAPQTDADYLCVIKTLRENRICELLKECCIPGKTSMFLECRKIANKYIDISLLFRDLYKFKFCIYYLTLEFLNWISHNSKAVKWIPKKNKEVLVSNANEEQIILVSSSATGAIIANTIGCLLDIPTVFILTLGPGEKSEVSGERVYKGIKFDELDNKNMIYVFDILRFGDEYNLLRGALESSRRCKFFLAIGVAHYAFTSAILSLLDLKINKDKLEYQPEVEDNNGN